MGLDQTCQRDVEFSALLHDVGKIRVPVEIINKPGKLDEREWELIRRHTIDGESMLKQMGGTLADVGPFVRSSHEPFDGLVFPVAWPETRSRSSRGSSRCATPTTP